MGRQRSSSIHFSPSSFRKKILDGCKAGYICLSAPNPGTSGPSSTAQPNAEVTTGLARQKSYPERLPSHKVKDRETAIFTSRWVQHNMGNFFPGPKVRWRAMTISSPQPKPGHGHGAGSSMPAVHMCIYPSPPANYTAWCFKCHINHLTTTAWHPMLKKKNTQ